MSDQEKFSVAQSIEVWKKIIDVQQHFNDIGWRIRSLAMTALTFTLGATFFGYLNADDVQIGSGRFNPSAFVPLLGLAIWALFWFADSVWYHRLLRGAGLAAGPVENQLRDHGIEAGLSGAITHASHESWLKIPMNSTRKLNLFYGMGTFLLVAVAVAIFFLTLDASHSLPVSPPSPTVVGGLRAPST